MERHSVVGRFFAAGPHSDGSSADLVEWACGAVSDINTDAKRPHDVHTNQARRGFQPNNYYEAGTPACFTPLQIQMLHFSRYLERFPVRAVHDSPKWLQGTHWARYRHHTENPMQVTEAPVSTRPRTGMPSRVSWPVMGGPMRTPNRGHLGQVTPLTV